MNAAVEAVKAARSAGTDLRLDGDDLLLEASSPPPPAVVYLLREKKPAIVALLRSANDEWSVEEWLTFFNERAAVARSHGGQPERKAHELAWECCLVEWLNRHPQQSDPGRCAGCGEPERQGRAVVPFGTGLHVWLHPECWHKWDRSRREQARQALYFGLPLCAAGIAFAKSAGDFGAD